MTDAKRPAIIAALMLALWQAQKEGVSIRRTDSEIIDDAAKLCEDAFRAAGTRQAAMGAVLAKELKSMAGTKTKKSEAAASIATVRTILHDLEKLGVGKTQLSADFLGQLYERFFQYTGAWRACAAILSLTQHLGQVLFSTGSDCASVSLACVQAATPSASTSRRAG
jgi:hypothetical protein